MVAGFAQSAEFTAATNGPLKTWMRARGPDDRLEAGEGQNLLAGGMMSDTFVFRADVPSRNTVADFEPWDRLALDGFGYGSAAAARAHMRQDGADLLFEDQGVTIRFLETGLAMMTDDVFLF